MEGRYTLKHPITLKGGDAPVVSEVVIRRPKGKDIRAADKASSDLDSTFVLIDRLCQMPDGGDVFPGFADELDVEDVEGLGERVAALLPSGNRTGETS
ncbi:phage tail assembly protein [Sphingopyxis granuli]|uniref:phage tail assembly protein n=1 Tax=Sphingopyxis granuli TaxID=267128 RepID=UPI001BAEA9D1|nr:phage tail assembly protein [Sphingopyxis granuli]QUM72180.1 phage tail assembly protein [Sphingopyxis granuli]